MPVLQGRFQPIAVAKHLRASQELVRACNLPSTTEIQDDRLVVRLQDDGSLVLRFGKPLRGRHMHLTDEQVRPVVFAEAAPAAYDYPG